MTQQERLETYKKAQNRALELLSQTNKELSQLKTKVSELENHKNNLELTVFDLTEIVRMMENNGKDLASRKS